jgi:threonine synthase
MTLFHQYQSTRSGVSIQSTKATHNASFCEILLDGLMPDGGLSVPCAFPNFASQLPQLSALSYPELAFELMRPFICHGTNDIISEADLKELLNRTYTAQVFGSEQITPISNFGNNLFLLHVSNGPSFAFKDIAMQFLGHLLELVLSRTQRHMTILGATSGDTGSAAEYAMRGKKNIQVFMLSPHGRMSAFQRAQMYGLNEPNIVNIAIEGVFDDCQDLVKQVNLDASFKQRYQIGAVNSINWARILAQMVYYFKAYAELGSAAHSGFDVCVPSGNFGNVYAAFVAKQMGLPIRKLIVATNENNVLDDFFKTGIYRPRLSHETLATSSPSMDISKASNFERYVFHLMQKQGTPERINALWQELATTGQFDLSHLLPEIASDFVSGASHHQNRLETMRVMYQQHRYVLDPHTADGVFVAQQTAQFDLPVVVVETAQAIKFNQTVQEALGFELPLTQAQQALLSQPQKCDVLAADLALLKQHITHKIDGTS